MAYSLFLFVMVYFFETLLFELRSGVACVAEPLLTNSLTIGEGIFLGFVRLVFVFPPPLLINTLELRWGGAPAPECTTVW